MRCVECEKGKLKPATCAATVKVAGTTFTAEVPGERCDKCAAEMLDGPALIRLDLAVALELGKRGNQAGEVLRFMRKAVGMRAVDLAELLDVRPETISRWESGAGPVDAATFATLGALVSDALAGQSDTLERLRARREPKRAPKSVRIELPPERRTA